MGKTVLAVTAKKGELIGYARVSTRDQNLDLQLDALRQAGCYEIYEEKLSATSKMRKELNLAIKALRPGDTLVVWRLDRIARSMRELYERLDQISDAGASFKSLTEEFDFTTATGKLVLGLFALVAEFERQLTIERTKAGMKAARERGASFGWKRKFTPDMQREAKWLLALKGQHKINKKKIAAKLGISVGLLHQWIKRGAKIEPVKKLKPREP
jgi:DNA invertase Pin-like site-specific DNA recombinase